MDTLWFLHHSFLLHEHTQSRYHQYYLFSNSQRGIFDISLSLF